MERSADTARYSDGPDASNPSLLPGSGGFRLPALLLVVYAVLFALWPASSLIASATETTPEGPTADATAQQPAQNGEAEASATVEAAETTETPETAVAPETPMLAASDAFPTVDAAYALAVTSDGNVLYDKGSQVSVPMASTTKIMTAILALESGLPFDTPYTVSQTAAGVESTTAGYREGETVTLGDMLRVMLAYSAGDAAYGIAECVSGSVDSFIELMNQRAQELGLTGTRFTSPDGYFDSGHYSTAWDLFIMARHAMGLPQFRAIVGVNSQIVPLAGVQTNYVCTNWLLNSYPGAQGVKTGYTLGAGYCFVGEADRGGRSVYVVVLGDPTAEKRRSDTETLLDYSFSLLPQTLLSDSSAPLAATGYVGVGYRFGWSAATSTGADLYSRVSPDQLSLTVDRYAQPVCGAMPGQTMGLLSWSDANGIMFSRPMTVTDRVFKTTEFGPFVSQLFYQLR